MPWITSKDNQKIHYKTYGEGRSVIFIHGWIMPSVAWIKQSEILTDYSNLNSTCNKKLIFPDLRGHGYSSCAKGPYIFSKFAEDLESLICELKIEKPVLVGWSMGAMIALEYVKTRNSSIAGLILVSATPCFMKSSKLNVGVNPARVKKLKEGLAQDYQKRIRLFSESIFTQKERRCIENINFLNKIYDSHGFPPSDNVVHETLEELLVWNQSDLSWLKKINTPSLIIHGAKDNVIPVESGIELSSYIYNSKFMTFDEAGHAPFISEPERFNREVTLFLKSIDCK